MRFYWSALLVCALGGCRHAPPAPTNARPQPSTNPSTSASTSEAPRRPASAAFELVASGDAALVSDRAPEPWRAAPFDAHEQTLIYAGGFPSSFAYRRDNVPCTAPDHGTVLLLQGKKWAEKRLLGRELPPHAFLAWDGGALLVDSLIQACGWATSSPVEQQDRVPGTSFTFFALNGATSHLELGLDPAFMAWGASSAQQTLSLVGTFGVRPLAGAAPEFGSRDVVVMRRHGKGPFKASLIAHATGPASQSQRTQIREFGAAALLWPPAARDDGTAVTGAVAEGGDEITWKGHAGSIFVIKDDATSEIPFRTASEQDCSVAEATLSRDSVYALVTCPSSPVRLVHAAAGAPPEIIALPPLGALACVPTQIIARTPTDLWLRASCGGTTQQPEISAVFRESHAQPP